MSMRWEARLPDTPPAKVARALRSLWEQQETLRQQLDLEWLRVLRRDAYFFALSSCIERCWSVMVGTCHINARSDLFAWLTKMMRKLYMSEPYYTRQPALCHNTWQPIVRALVLHFARRGYGVTIQGLLTSEPNWTTDWTITISDTPQSRYSVPVAPQAHLAVSRLQQMRRYHLPFDLVRRVLEFSGRVLFPIHVGPQPDGGHYQGPGRDQPWLWGLGWGPQ
eukprot:TRINITY_DN53221_c0_g1_i1.p1 TRINITY_DN53221_c0_g1~~TRINITY_DN53221_c0_g1_i1.p1  ORF type:complete len:222 (+),score=54.17 TRINITY_DN53221_c0_g1_i1:86-751(+)